LTNFSVLSISLTRTKDWDDELPPEQLERAEETIAKADLVLCLGTSLRYTKGCVIRTEFLQPMSYPSYAKKGK
jgi:hypothetical protein